MKKEITKKVLVERASKILKEANMADEMTLLDDLMESISLRSPPTALPARTLRSLAHALEKGEDATSLEGGVYAALKRTQEALRTNGLLSAPPRFEAGLHRSFLDFRTPTFGQAYVTGCDSLLMHIRWDVLQSEKRRAALCVLWFAYVCCVWDTATVRRFLNSSLQGALQNVGERWVFAGQHFSRVVYLDPVLVTLLKSFRDADATLSTVLLGRPAKKRQRGVAYLWKVAVQTLGENRDIAVPESHRLFTKYAEAFAAGRVDGFVINYLRGKTRGLAATPEILEHLLSSPSTPEVAPGFELALETANGNRQGEPGLVRDENRTLSIVAERLTGVFEAVKNNDWDYFRDREVLAEFPTLDRLFAWIAEEGAQSWPSLSPPDLKRLPRLLEKLAKTLAEELDHEDITTVDTEVVLEFYEQVIEAHDDERSLPALCRLIGRWHRAPGMPPINRRQLRGFRISNDGVINTALLSESGYRSLLAPLAKAAETDMSSLCEAVLLIMGYRLGLRRSEAVTRCLNNVEDGGPWVLHVQGKLKTTSAIRPVPMAVLVPAGEFALIKRLYARRSSEAATTEELLIPESQKPKRLLDRLTRRIQKLTANKEAGFHCLRHSYANWLIVQGWRYRPGVELSVLAGLMGSHEIAKSSRLWAILSQKRLGGWAFQVARLMGHINPAVTSKHYLHVIDAIAEYHARMLAPRLSMRQVQVLMGAKREGAAYKRVPPALRVDGRVSVWDLDWLLSPKTRPKRAPLLSEKGTGKASRAPSEPEKPADNGGDSSGRSGPGVDLPGEGDE